MSSNTAKTKQTKDIWLHRVRFVQRVAVARIIGPRDHRHEIGHKRRNRALENGRVAANDVLVVHLRLVELLDNCVCDLRYCGGGQIL